MALAAMWQWRWPYAWRSDCADCIRRHTPESRLAQPQRSYVVTVDADRFPVDAFMPLLGVGAVTARIDADGHGYNPFSETMRLDASLAVDNAVYSDILIPASPAMCMWPTDALR